MAKQQKTSIIGTDSAPVIWDNQERSAADFLRQQLAPGVLLRAASAYFSIYGYNALKPGIDEIGKMRFLFGDPKSAASPDPLVDKTPSYELTEDGLKPTETLQQKALAAECAKWIEEKAEVRTITKTGFMHGKMFHISGGDSEKCSALAGSSNFTARGLGATKNGNLELNLAIQSSAGQDELATWFDGIWNNKKLTRDAKKEMLAALERLAKDYSPKFVYYKTLFELFYDRLMERETEGKHLEELHFYDTEIWKTLYEFQRDGVHGAIHRLLTYNGCIIADSVGLGKTYEALAVIKYFEKQGINCLILCPKRMGNNWKRFQYWSKNNPLKSDNFRYSVLSHTDLSRNKGYANGIDLEKLDWGGFGLVVIDESHNFRNIGGERSDSKGNIRQSRYKNLLEKVIKAGAKTRVLMLSATPVNNNLTDLLNQINLMTQQQDDGFTDLGIRSLQTLFAMAQRRFKEWENERNEKRKQVTKADLLEKLGSEFLTLLDAISIARSRRHIEQHYSSEMGKLGGFPQRAKPRNESPATDTKGELSYEEINRGIKSFGLSIYNPSEYVVSEEKKKEMEEEKEKRNFNQKDRERYLIGMLRVNFLKRLESSAHAFTLTLERTLGRIENMIERIEGYQRVQDDREIEAEMDDEADNEDDEFISGRRVRYRLSELDTERWLIDLRRDRKSLHTVCQIAKKVDVTRDAKLLHLKQILQERIRKPTINKDGEECRKALIFTVFSDTAKYLHENLEEWAKQESINMALVTGGGDNKTTLGSKEFEDILDNFSPRTRREESHVGNEIDFLIATDCISEGQNLQDCDWVINYDIHWNPTRLIQRFGRIDRIGSKAQEVQMINFWPMEDLDLYIDLKSRVEARMCLVDATATGQDNPIDNDEKAIAEAAELELNYRDRQLSKMRENAAAWDGQSEEDGVEMSDFTLDDFIAELKAYLESNSKELKDAPLGIYALTNADQARHENATEGVIFCFRHISDTLPNKMQKASSLHPHYLVYVAADGKVRYRFGRAKQILGIMGALCRNEKEPLTILGDIFNMETENGHNMGKYDSLLMPVIKNIDRDFSYLVTDRLTRDFQSEIPRKGDRPDQEQNFQLVTWLIIKKS